MLLPSDPVRAEARWCLRQCRAPRVRSLSQFVQDEIVIPEGPAVGRRFKFYRQPYAKLAFEAIDSGFWTRFAFPGCVQSGKSFHFWVIPIVYHACEIGENVVVGVPDLQLAHTKWTEEIAPVLRATRYACLIPSKGRGSKGGVFDELKLRNGATIKFMSGHGGDAKRSSFTSRIVVATEVDKYDRPPPTSREPDPITQMQDRADAWDFMLRRTYLECTVSIEEGRIWQEWLKGTASKIAVQCPHCRHWVTPEREHLVGWQDAATEIAAYKGSYWACPACAERLPEKDRRKLLLAGRLVHRGQEIDVDGNVHGEPPETVTFGFRWSAYGNMFWSPGAIGIKEWQAKQSDDESEDSKERELRQFCHVIPHEPPALQLVKLDSHKLRRRFNSHRQGFVPAEAEHFTLGIDIGKWLCWWTAIAWEAGATAHVVDYGTLTVPSDSMATETAILTTLREFRDGTIEEGWITAGGRAVLPETVFIDARYQGDQPGSTSVFQFCRESGNRYLPLLGWGIGKRYLGRYRQPEKISKKSRFIGQQYHIDWDVKHRLFIAQLNVDFWKGWLQARLETPADQPGALRFFQSPDKNKHGTICKHYASEIPEEVFIPGVGNVITYTVKSKVNHYLDAGVYACAGGHFAGVRLIDDPEAPPPAPVPDTRIQTPDGRAFIASDR